MDTKALRQKVLDIAIRGKLVPQDPNDEPASVLLERIRQQKQQMVKEGTLKAKDIKNDTIIFVGEDSLHYEKFADGSVKCIEDEIPFDLPEGWAWSRLGTVAEAIGDGDHQPPPQTSNGVPFLVISNVSGGRLSFEKTRFVSEEYFSQLPETRKPRNGDLLFTVTGSYGIPVLVDTDDKFCFQRHIAIIRPCIISNHYLYVILGSSYVKSICDDKATGTAQKTVGLATLRELLIPVAPNKEQMRVYVQTQDTLNIVDRISLDKEDLLNIIENTKSKILDLAIRGQLVPQDPTDESASVLLERIREEKEDLIRQGKIKRNKKESVIFRGEDNSYYEKVDKTTTCIDDELPFELPDSWSWCRLGSICSGIQYGLSNSAELSGTHKLLRITDIQNGKVDWETVPFTTVQDDEHYLLRSADIVFARTGATVGKSFLITDIPYDSVYASYLIRIRLMDGIDPAFVYDFFNSLCYWNQITNKAVGIGQPNCNGTSLSNLLIPVPPMSMQSRITTAVKSILTYVTEIEKSLSLDYFLFQT